MLNIKTNNFKPLVTIVTVTYNAEEYLERTIQSIITQDYKNIEYILIDANSTDNTLSIINKYNEYISYWISESDNGIYDAMNKAINKASGEFINFLNAGDTFCHEKIVSQVINSIDSSVDLVYGDYNLLENKTVKYVKAKNIGDFFKGIPFCHQSLFSKTLLMKKYKFNLSYSIAADYDFILKSYLNNYNFKYLDFAFSDFLSEGISKLNIIKSSIEAMHVISNYTNDISIVFNSNPCRILENEKKGNGFEFSVLLNRFHLKINELELKKKKFVLYGYGKVGKLIYQEYKNNIEIVVDQNNKRINTIPELKIFHPDYLKNFAFEYIVISVLGREEQIIKYLCEELMISKNKIIVVDF